MLRTSKYYDILSAVEHEFLGGNAIVRSNVSGKDCPRLKKQDVDKQLGTLKRDKKDTRCSQTHEGMKENRWSPFKVQAKTKLE